MTAAIPLGRAFPALIVLLSGASLARGQSNQEVMNGLLAKLYEVVTAPDAINANAGSRRLSTSSLPPFIAFCSPGVAIEGLDFGDLTTMDQVNRCSRFSHLVNSVPAVSGLYVPTGTKVWNIYYKAIHDIELPDASLTAKDDQMLKKAEAFLRTEVQTKDPFTDEVKTEVRPSAQVQAYEKMYAAYAQSLAALHSARISAISDPTPANVNYWTSMGPTLEQSVRNAYGAWGTLGYRDYVTRATGIISSLLSGGPWPIYERLRNNLQLSERKDFLSQSFWPTLAYPPKVLDPEFANSWVRFVMSKGEVSSYSSRDKTSWGGGVSAGFGLFSFGGGASYTSAHERADCNTDTFDLSVELITVPITRGWMESWIFSSRGWKGGSTIGRPGSISSGDPKDLTGQMPLVPTAIVLAKNLKVTLDKSKVMSASDYSRFEKSVSAGWGPFSVRANHVSEHQSASHTSRWNGQTLECPGAQMIAVICEVLPKSPDPDPALDWGKPEEVAPAAIKPGTEPRFDLELLKWLR